MRNQTGINAADFLYGPTPAPKRTIDLRPKASAPTGSLTPGRGGRRRMPRPGEGVHETAQMAYDFLEPGYVHAARTGTVPESALGKGLLAAETTLDLAPGLGKVVGMALPFGLMRKVDPVEVQRKTFNIRSQYYDEADSALEKYMPEESVIGRVPPVEEQKALLESNNLLDLVHGATKKEAKKWRQAVKSLPASERQGFPIHNIDTMYPAGRDTGSIIADQIGEVNDMDELMKNPNFPLFNLTARAVGNIETASKNIIEKLGSGEIKRTVGHKQKAQLVKDFITAEADRQAHLKALPQVRNKSKEIGREARKKAKEAGDRYEADELIRLHDEAAVSFGEDHADMYYPEFGAQAKENARGFRAEQGLEELRAGYEAKAKQTVQGSIPAQRKEILNQLQEKGTYDPKNRMEKGFGEDAEALREMQKDLQSYNPMNMRIRSV
jgi:hypothetical protein